MKTKTLFSLIIMLITTQVFYAQSNTDKIPKFEISGGLGINSTFSSDKPQVEIPPLSLSAEYRVSDNFSFGILGAYSRSRFAFNGPSKKLSEEPTLLRSKYTTIGFRMSGHIITYKKLDFYAGIGLNLGINKIEVLNGDEIFIRNTAGVKPLNASFYYTAHAGIRYSINQTYNVFSEVGFGDAILKLGMSRKLY